MSRPITSTRPLDESPVTRGVLPLRTVGHDTAPVSTSVERTFQVRSEAQRQGDDRQGRIGMAGGGKYAASGDKQICHTVHAAVFVDDARARVRAHPSGAEMMRRIGVLDIRELRG